MRKLFIIALILSLLNAYLQYKVEVYIGMWGWVAASLWLIMIIWDYKSIYKN